MQWKPKWSWNFVYNALDPISSKNLDSLSALTLLLLTLWYPSWLWSLFAFDLLHGFLPAMLPLTAAEAPNGGLATPIPLWECKQRQWNARWISWTHEFHKMPLKTSCFQQWTKHQTLHLLDFMLLPMHCSLEIATSERTVTMTCFSDDCTLCA